MKPLVKALSSHATEPYLSRFLADVREDGTHFVWTGRINPSGYGIFSIHGQTVSAHRLAYEWANGPVHSWLDVDHTCRVKLCIRPEHTEAVTHLENVRRGRVCEELRRNPHPLANYLFNNEVSIADFAEQMFTTPRTISLMLRGHRPTNPELVYRVGAALNMSWEETDNAFRRRREQIEDSVSSSRRFIDNRSRRCGEGRVELPTSDVRPAGAVAIVPARGDRREA